MSFLSREDAGRQLGDFLKSGHIEAQVVLGLPRGGVVVAAQVAEILNVPLDVVVVRKIGHPRHREFAVGAMAEGDVIILDENALAKTSVVPEDLREVIDEERERLRTYQQQFEAGGPVDLTARSVLVVDDGLATGASTEAAVRSVRKRGAREVMLAIPVASDNGYARLNRVCDAVFALNIDPDFDAVGRYYSEFTQTTDEEVIALLEHDRRRWLAR
jgi:putative phosphoribosyl transferase